jgi:acyl-[acyl-carrier-protein]-phospholipid O-acyltransferase/long-chain-fatty-acid--[acyl-carrier-protein] ligase
MNSDSCTSTLGAVPKNARGPAPHVATGTRAAHNRPRMSSNQIHLLGTRRFLPLFLVQFLGAFNDNVFKGAFTILAAFHFTKTHGWDANIAPPIIGGVFILPFFVFSAFAGQIADKFEKARLVRWVKVWEIGAMALGATAFVLDDPWLLFTTLFLMGTQSAFFGPLKYSMLPYHLRKDELVGGNAIFEAATFVSILVGTIFGQELILADGGRTTVIWGVLGVAFAGWLASLFVPLAPSETSDLRINWNMFTATRDLVGAARKQRGVFQAILGISWFWLVGIFWLTAVPGFVEGYLHGDKTAVTICYAVFSVGVGVGSLLCNRMLRGEITAKFVPLAAVVISVFMLDFAWFASGLGDRYVDAVFTFRSLDGVRLIVDLAGIAIAGGVFTVPLYAMMQSWAEPARRSRVIAANNVMNALFMTCITLVVAVLHAVGFGTPAIIVLIAAANLCVAVYVVRLVPESLIQTGVRWVLRLIYKVEVRGEENYAKAGERRVIIANHTSFLDAVLLTAFLPERPTFAIHTEIARRWWVRPFLWAVDVHPLDTTKPMAIKILTDLARAGKPIVIFPEGRLTVTGALMKVYEGPGLVADKADADLVPVQIDGAIYTPFSRLHGKVRQRWFPKITLTILPPRKFHAPPGVYGRAARQVLARELYEMLAQINVATADTGRTLFQGLLDAARVHGRGFEVLEDTQFKRMTYRRLIATSLFLGPRLCAGTAPGDAVGLLIANSNAAVASFFGVQSSGRVCAMLNYSAGPANLVAACRTACVRVVWTSERFVRLAKLEAAVEAMRQSGVEVQYLETLKGDRFAALRGVILGSLFPQTIARLRAHTASRELSPVESEADRPAVILFTSGSSGTPKAVVLSHRNLQHNRHQLAARIDFNRRDRFFNCLPVFHAFGLTGGTIVPLLSGAPVFMYPTPLHYGVIPELIYQTNATILFGTNTFLAGYARRAHPYDFFSVRYVFAGAEKLKESTRKVWADRFGVRIFEGYGATETAPALTMNTPMHNKPGTVGRFLPGIEWRLESVPGIDRGGRLFVRGGNIMRGYYLHETPGVLQPPADGWYDTGDIVEVDAEGYVAILGRAKRFAKIGGEMVSLTAVEELASATWPQALHAAVVRPHPQKGEEIVLVTEHPDPKRADLLAVARERGIPELTLPRALVFRKKLPVLGSGKPDYVTLEEEVRASPSGIASDASSV